MTDQQASPKGNFNINFDAQETARTEENNSHISTGRGAPLEMPRGVDLVMQTGISRPSACMTIASVVAVWDTSTSRPANFFRPIPARPRGARRSRAAASIGVPPSSGFVSDSTPSPTPGSLSCGWDSPSSATPICPRSGETSRVLSTACAGVAPGDALNTSAPSSYTRPDGSTYTYLLSTKGSPCVVSANLRAAQDLARTCPSRPCSDRLTSASLAMRRKGRSARPGRSARGVCGAPCRSRSRMAGLPSADGASR